MKKPFYILILCEFWLLSAQLSAQHAFTDVTSQMNISAQGNYGQAAAWCDIDNDMDLDIAFSTEHGANFYLYRNDGNTFTDITTASGLGSISATKILWGEITGDTLNDLITASFIYKNNGDNIFTDITPGSNLPGGHHSLADFNNDGKLDILVLNNGCKIHYNMGNGVFSGAFIVGGNYLCSAISFDYNLDGYTDIYAGNTGTGQNFLSRNNGDSTFTDVTATSGLLFTGYTHALDVGDYNNDGYPDVYVGFHLGQTSPPANKLMKNNGNGTFTDVTTTAGVEGTPSMRSASFCDYNNDGYTDIFVDDHYQGNLLYHNNADGTFTDMAQQMNITGGFGDYFGMSWGDFNFDGAVDLFVTGHFHIYKLYKNEFCPGNYIQFVLKGTNSGYNGVGSHVKLWTNGNMQTRQVIAGNGKNDFHSLPVEFGLGDANQVDSIHVLWHPGTLTKVYALQANQVITVHEEQTGFIHISPNAFDYEINTLDSTFSDTFYITNNQDQEIALSSGITTDTSGHWITPLFSFQDTLQPMETKAYVFQINTSGLQAGFYEETAWINTAWNNLTLPIHLDYDPPILSKQELFGTGVRIYPNPAKAFLSINLEGFRTGAARIKLYSYATGYKVHELPNIPVNGTGKITLDLNKLNIQSGIYIVQVAIGERMTHKKVMIFSSDP